MENTTAYWEEHLRVMCERWRFHVYEGRFELVIEDTKANKTERHQFTDISEMKKFVLGRYVPIKIARIGQHNHIDDVKFNYLEFIRREQK